MKTNNDRFFALEKILHVSCQNDQKVMLSGEKGYDSGIARTCRMENSFRFRFRLQYIHVFAACCVLCQITVCQRCVG